MAFSRSEEIYKRFNVVFARGRDSKIEKEKGEDAFYPYYPAQIVEVQETCVFVKWFTPNEHEKWSDDDDDGGIEQICKQKVIAFTPENIKLIKEQEMQFQPPDTLKSWEDCVAAANEKIKDQDADKTIQKFEVNQ